jgi:hypothetical protein
VAKEKNADGRGCANVTALVAKAQYCRRLRRWEDLNPSKREMPLEERLASLFFTCHGARARAIQARLPGITYVKSFF